MTDKNTIEINGLRLLARHGVGAQELQVGNIFEIDLSISFNANFDANTDDLNGTINYAEVVEIIRQQMAIPSKLLENVVYRVRNALIKAYPQIYSGRVKLAKLAPPILAIECHSVAFALEW